MSSVIGPWGADFFPNPSELFSNDENFWQCCPVMNTDFIETLLGNPLEIWHKSNTENLRNSTYFNTKHFNNETWGIGGSNNLLTSVRAQLLNGNSINVENSWKRLYRMSMRMLTWMLPLYLDFHDWRLLLRWFVLISVAWTVTLKWFAPDPPIDTVLVLIGEFCFGLPPRTVYSHEE